MTFMTRFLPTRRSIARSSSLLLVFSLFCVADSAFCQPPQFPAFGGRDAETFGQNAPQDEQGQAKQNPDQPKQEPRVDLEKALDNALGTTAIRLNQTSFRSSDNVQLLGTYFKGKGDKDTAVVILIPDLNADEKVYAKTAALLANKGYAVLIPELRQLAQDRRSRNNNPPNDTRQAQARVASTPTAADVDAMINRDREVWFRFLFYVNDKGLCNVKKTIIVGAEFSAALACAWAKNDWSIKGAYGQNVVGLALLSPDAVDDKKKSKSQEDESSDAVGSQKYDCLNSLEALRKTAKGKAVGYLLFVGGNNSEKLESAQLIQQKIGGAKDEQAKPQDKIVLLNMLKTGVQGTGLLSGESFKAPSTLAVFIEKRLRETPKKRDRWSPIDADLSKEDKSEEKKRG